jgi:2-keto-4-pentenoate hydratase/2-oxohepta-3-ene-1,7-dioic acid hydratase in catechol pathway
MSGVHTLLPGDIISSGTVKAAEGRHILKEDMRRTGGILESFIEGIGVMKNSIRAI